MGRLQRKKSQQTKNKKKKVENTNKGQLITGSKNFGNSVAGKLSLAEHKKNPFRKIFTFLKEAKSELKKVVWPNKKQTIGSTLVVIVIVGLVSLFLGIVDAGISGIIRMFLG